MSIPPVSDPGPQHDLLAEIADRLDRIEAALTEGSTAPGRWMGLKAAAHYCGASEKSLRRLVAAGKLTPSRAIRGKVLLDRQQIDALFMSTTTPRRGRGRA